eukprot:TRINITY_DN6565_c0_g4_i1.p1 TRINITY_DN6565_c0_g4~~TRINITY_DN6565_c0_g4_i1.p1  ORF type:complete len:951 (+),score=116.47 TRINITY_DN6565_c0_g4_i1:3-2855(+)
MAYLSIHSPPRVNFVIRFEQQRWPISYTTDMVAGLLMLPRIYLLWRLFAKYSFFNSDQAIMVCRKALCGGGTTFALKAELKTRPYLIVSCLLVICVSIYGFAIRNCERTYTHASGQDWEYIWNGMWCIMMIMTTAGYGDYFPKTHLGRCLAVLASFSGAFLLSVMIVALTISCQFTPAENNAYAKLQQTEAAEALCIKAANTIKNVLLLWVRLKKEEKGSKRISFQARKFKSAILQFKIFRKELRQRNHSEKSLDDLIVESRKKIAADFVIIREKAFLFSSLVRRFVAMEDNSEALVTKLDHLLDMNKRIKSRFATLKGSNPIVSPSSPTNAARVVGPPVHLERKLSTYAKSAELVIPEDIEGENKKSMVADNAKLVEYPRAELEETGECSAIRLSQLGIETLPSAKGSDKGEDAAEAIFSKNDEGGILTFAAPYVRGEEPIRFEDSQKRIVTAGTIFDKFYSQALKEQANRERSGELTAMISRENLHQIPLARVDYHFAKLPHKRKETMQPININNFHDITMQKNKDRIDQQRKEKILSRNQTKRDQEDIFRKLQRAGSSVKSFEDTAPYPNLVNKETKSSTPLSNSQRPDSSSNLFGMTNNNGIGSTDSQRYLLKETPTGQSSVRSNKALLLLSPSEENSTISQKLLHKGSNEEISSFSLERKPSQVKAPKRPIPGVKFKFGNASNDQSMMATSTASSGSGHNQDSLKNFNFMDSDHYNYSNNPSPRHFGEDRDSERQRVREQSASLGIGRPLISKRIHIPLLDVDSPVRRPYDRERDEFSTKMLYADRVLNNKEGDSPKSRLDERIRKQNPHIYGSVRSSNTPSRINPILSSGMSGGLSPTERMRKYEQSPVSHLNLNLKNGMLDSPTHHQNKDRGNKVFNLMSRNVLHPTPVRSPNKFDTSTPTALPTSSKNAVNSRLLGLDRMQNDSNSRTPQNSNIRALLMKRA